jgi:hypothetical protein
MSLTWEQFNDQVRLYLHNYNKVTEVQGLIDVAIIDSVEDLQRTVDFYQTGHKTTYDASALTTQGYVQLGVAPLGRIRGARMVKYDTTEGLLNPNIFRTLRQVAWRHVPTMRGGEASAFTGMIAIDPVTRAFAVSPPLNSETRLVLEWVGVKSSFSPGDITPFDSRAAEAVGLNVLAKLSRVVDRDMALATSYTQSYIKAKRILLSETRWNAIVSEQVESQGEGEDTYTESAIDTLMDLFAYRPDITSLLSGTATSLNGVPTAFGVALTGTVLFLVISGVPQYWRLVAGTDATDESAGFIRPVDFNSVSNARVWSRLT